jgi:Peptidase family M28
LTTSTKTMQKLISTATILTAFLAIIFSIRLSAPGPVKEGKIADSAFSVQKAFIHLQKIAAVPHMPGSAAHQVVKEYITAQCKAMGFDVQVQEAVPVTLNWGNVQAAFVQNIIAVKKGTTNSKAVVLMAHYDSEPNTTGAGDDGAGVAAILETARALQKTDPLKNDLILLFTDGEEIGLMGAHAFVKESAFAKNIGIVLNFEARGNSGPSNMFEVNEQNGWAINEYATAAAHPFANSLGYEVYKKLPNSTDYTVFKEAGITGLNNAFIDGFVNYHSPTDKPENLDLRSMQHHGENMLSLAKHFGNLHITDTKGSDSSYFNAVGSWFIHYPAAWNLYIVVLVNIFMLWYLVIVFKNKHAKAGGFIFSVLLFPAILAIVFFAAKFLLQKIINWYPMYTHFHENNSYNCKWYFLAMASLALFLFTLVYFLVSKKIRFHALFAGIVLVSTLLLDGMQYAIPSASYLLSFPLLFLLSINIFLLSSKKYEDSLFVNKALTVASVLPAIFILAPIVYFTFIAFGLGGNMPFVVIAAALLAGLLLPVWYAGFKTINLGLPVLAFACFIMALFLGHRYSGYDKEYPLQTNIRYEEDASTEKANWISEYTQLDKWSNQFFTNAITEKRDWGSRLISNAPALSLPAPEAIVVNDSMVNSNRFVTVLFKTNREAVMGLNISIRDSSEVASVTISGKSFTAIRDGKKTYQHNVYFAGNIPGGAKVMFELPAEKKLDITVNDKTIGLPVIKGFDTRYPSDIIPGVGYGSNTVQARKRFIL